MIRTPYIGMVNLIAGRQVAPELIQDAFTPEAVETEVRRLLESETARAKPKAGWPKYGRKWAPAAPSNALRIFLRGCCKLSSRATGKDCWVS